MTTVSIDDIQWRRLPLAEGAFLSQIRISQSGTKGGWSSFDFTEPPQTLKMYLANDGYPTFACELMATETAPHGLGMKHSVALAIIPLQNGTFVAELYDPSLRVKDGYEILGEITITISDCVNIVGKYNQTKRLLPELFEFAKEEREKGTTVWKEKYEKNIINPKVKDFFLKTFTLKVQGLKVPAYYFAYIGRYLDPADPKVVEYMYRMCTAIRFTTIEEMEGWLKNPAKMTDDQIMKCENVIGDMLTFGATSTYYTGDHAGAEEVERFSACIYQRLNQGDCDDMAQAIFTTYHTFVKSNIPYEGLKRLLDAYDCVFSIGAASYGRLLNATSSKDFICHIWAILIPKKTMNGWLGRTQFKDLSEELQSRIHVLNLEGTNFSTYHGLEKGYYYKVPAEENKEISRAKQGQVLYEKVCKDIPELANCIPVGFRPLKEAPKNAFELSKFYCYTISLWTSYDEICFNMIHKNKVGAELQHVLRSDPTIKLVPHLKTSELDDSEKKAVLASDNQLKALKTYKTVPDKVRGKVDKDNFVEFRCQTHIDGVIQKLDKFNYSYIIREVRITSHTQVISLIVSPAT
jgi:hypothetical protein